MKKIMATTAAVLAFTATAAMADQYALDFTGVTGEVSSDKYFDLNDDFQLKTSAAAYRMATETTVAADVTQTYFAGLGVGSISDWDTLGAGTAAVNWASTGPGETLFFDFGDSTGTIDTITVGGMFTAGVWPSFVAALYALDEDNNIIETIALSPTVAIAGSIADSNEVATATGVDFGSLTFDTNGLLPEAHKFGFSGWFGIDHLDTHCSITCIDGTFDPVPEPATMALFGLGLAGLVGVTRRRRQK